MESFLIIGMGRFGSSLATELAVLGHEVLVIDKDEEPVSEIADTVTHSVIGDAGDEAVLRSVGAENFDVAVVAIAGNIEESVLITMMLKEMGVGKVVSKAHSSLHMKILKKIGADIVVFPERDMGERLARSLSSKDVVDYIELSDEYSIVELRSHAEWEKKTLAELDFREVYGLNVIAVTNETAKKTTVSPGAEYEIASGDELIVVGKDSDIKKLQSKK